MAVKLRLARGGAKKRPYYYIVAAHSTSPRDGRYIEQVGTYDPMLGKDNPGRIKLNEERCKHWLSVGAQPTDRVARFLEAAGVKEKAERKNLKKGVPGKAAQDRAAKRAEREAAANAPAEEAASE